VKMDKSLLSGSTGMLLLRLLKTGEKCGSEMIALLEEAGNETFRMREAAIYPTLHRLEQKGLVRSCLGQAAAGRTRRRYRLTPKGDRRMGSGMQSGLKEKIISLKGKIRLYFCV
jgi:PadR family transcriptional regulator PadR